jgi:hypothetical protein
MIKESIDSLETKLGKRKQFLFDDNLEQLQEEFIKNKEKCSSKIIKKEAKKTDIKQDNNNNMNNIVFPVGEIKKKKGKKKVKDVISLNLPQMSTNQNTKKDEIHHSLFSLNYDQFKNKDNNNNVDIETGLPETFKIVNNNSMQQNNNNIINNNNDNNINLNNKNINNDVENINSKEYDEINKENCKKIEEMSEAEILEAQKEIYASIPSDLIEKFKANFFSQQIKKSLNNKNDLLLNKQNNNDNEIIKGNDNKNIKKEATDTININNIKNNIKLNTNYNDHIKKKKR